MQATLPRLMPTVRRWADWKLQVAKAAIGPHGVVRRRLGVEEPAFLKVDGTCPTCGPAAHFVSEHSWLRDHFLCTRCGSIPRDRALMATIRSLRPNWHQLTIHESSPGFRGVSPLLKRRARILLLLFRGNKAARRNVERPRRPERK